MADHPATVVVLRFADRIMVDVVTGLDAKSAIADFAGRALANGATLPLIEALTSEIPIARLAALAGAQPSPAPIARPPIPVNGAVHAVSAYYRQARTGKGIANARGALTDFFGRFGCTLSFAGEPDPEPIAPAPPEKRGLLIDPTNSHGGDRYV